MSDASYQKSREFDWDTSAAILESALIDYVTRSDIGDASASVAEASADSERASAVSTGAPRS